MKQGDTPAVKENDEEMETAMERIKRKKAYDSGPSSSEEPIKKPRESEKANTSSSEEETDASNGE